MTLRNSLGLLASCFILLCSVAYRTLVWCWHAPPAAFSFFGIAGNKKKSPVRRISSPIHDLNPSYDVVVIGSGYGGGVAASRMARAQPKQSVCVLESGEERWPEELGYWHGGFPSSALQVLSELRVTGHLFSRFLKPWPVTFGKANGLYKWICGKESNAFVANGLGGTSLVNANVFLKPHPQVFQSAEWPTELREPGALDSYFERAEATLQPETYPQELPPIEKQLVLQQQAHAVGLWKQFTAVRQTVAFRDKTNTAGVHLNASRLSGQDSVGLNDGSKNTVLATYLADAFNFGAEIYCGCEVRYIRKHCNGGYIVFFRDNASKLFCGPFKEKLRWVHAKRFVFLGAGSIGSTEIVLRSQNQGLSTSPQVGKGLSGNGSMLSFGYDLDPRLGQVNPLERPGPTISSMVECPDDEHWEQSFIVQDGSWPHFMDTVFRITKPILPITLPSYMSVASSAKQISSLLNPFSAALRHTQLFLALGHDKSCGSITLEDDLPLLDMRGVEQKSNSARVRSLLKRMTHAFGGTYIEQGCKVTVHPLGGLGFASNGTGRTGSTSHTGELFTGNGREVHAGLCVVDGSVISRSLAANPLATITAVAERSVELLADKAGLCIDLVTTKTLQDRYNDSSVTFSEKMKGTIKFGGNCVPLTLYVDVAISHDKHAAQGRFHGRLSGTVCCPHISDDQLSITNGLFRLFEADQARADLSTMEYRFDAIATNGDRFLMVGRKLLGPSITFSIPKVWQASTTLLLDVTDTNGRKLGSGVLRLSARNFVDQMRTMTTSGCGIYSQRTFLMQFFMTFASGLLKHILSPFAPLQYPEDHNAVEEAHEFYDKVEPRAVIKLKAADGVASTLRMWEPIQTQSNNGAIAHDILLVPGTAVTHWMYASPYIKRNAIEHFTQGGYRCWCVTPRFAKQHHNSEDVTHSWTAYDGRLDIAAALAEIKRYNIHRSTQYLPPYVIAHCAGSLAFASALLTGTVHKSAISGLTVSQNFLHPVLQPLNEVKARTPLTRLYRLVAGDWFPITQSKEQASSDVLQSLLDTLLRFYPVGSREEICDSPICHRCELAFGRLWNHRNLNKATHDNQHNIYGGMSSKCLEHLASGGRRQTVLDNDYRSLVTEENLEQLRGTPIFLFSGADNNVFKASSTLKTYRFLKARGEKVSRKEFPGFGHLDCWMSEKSADTVYKAIEEEVRKVMV
ncbi:hypothetical protein MBLNU13_g11643t1 [Cladosporium sp. NU13]